MSHISDEVIGGKSTRRRMVCCNCGKFQMPSRRQRASRFRPTCRYCGCSRFEPSEGSLLHAEIAVVQETKRNARKMDSGQNIL